MRRHRNRFAVIVLLSGLTLGAHAANRYAAGKRGLETVARAFLDKGADLRRLTLALKPKPGDYDAIFRDKESAAKARAYGERVWRQVGRQPIDPRAKYDHVLVFEATPEDLKAGRGDAPHFAGGMRRIAERLRPGIKVYSFKFVRRGESLGYRFDGVFYLAGRWVLLPKPWRAFH